MSIQIVDNFLPDFEFKSIQNILLGPQIPWFNNPYIIDREVKDDIESFYDYQFTHVFYRNYTICSEFFQILDPILVKLNPSAILRIKANLIPRADKIVEHQMHVDVTHFKGKTAVFYLNSNDGYTLFYNGTKVESVENRMVIFNSKDMHTGTTCTNTKNRCVLNFNFYEWDFT